MGTFGTPSSYNNTGALGSATNPTTAQGLSRDRENQKAILELDGTQAYESVTILDGSISPKRAEIIVDTEGGASADTLETILTNTDGSTTLHDGMKLTLRSADPSRSVTVKHSNSEFGIQMVDAQDVVLGTKWGLKLKLIANKWFEDQGRAEILASEAMDTAEEALGRTNPATTTSRGIARVATLADMEPGAVVENGPAVLAAGSEALNALVPTLLIGSIISTYAADEYVPNGCVPPDGAEYTESQFPTFYTDYLVAGRVVTCTYTEFDAQVALTGNCGKFALDIVNKKFKVPLLKDGDSITQATSAGEIGKSVEAALPNATGSTSSSSGDMGVMVQGGFSGSGVFADNTIQRVAWSTPTGASQGMSALNFDLSKSNPIYRNGVDTVLDEQVRLRHFVVLASAQNNSSMFDWSNYMAALAGKANNDLSNVDLNKVNLVLQRVRYQTSANATTQVTMPFDNTVPQITEGTQFMSINFTPRKADSRLVIDALFNGMGYGSSGWYLIVAIFQDTTPDAIVSGAVHGTAANQTRILPLSIEVPASSVAPRTYSVRAGCSAGGMGFNGLNAGSYNLGGTVHSHITVTEYAV